MGVNAVTVRRWELGLFSPSAKRTGRVAEAYGVDVSTLLEAAGSGEPDAGTALVPVTGYLIAGIRPKSDATGPDTISLPFNIIEGRLNSYCLVVCGDSLVPDGIHNGDFLVVSPDDVPSIGSLCVLDVESCFCAATYITRGQFRLSTPTGRTEELGGDSIQLAGTITWHIRRM